MHMHFEGIPRLKYLLLPFFVQLGVLGVCIFLHRVIVRLGPVMGVAEIFGEKAVYPTTGRLLRGSVCGTANGRPPKERMLSAIPAYYGTAILAFGLMEGQAAAV